MFYKIEENIIPQIMNFMFDIRNYMCRRNFPDFVKKREINVKGLETA